MQEYMQNEKISFKKILKEPHRRVDPCFMTGKGCVNTEIIDRVIDDRKKENKSHYGFMVVPFRPNMNVFFDLCLNRYLREIYSTKNEKFVLMRADQIRKTGYVICEKICKKIQESDFIVVDISVPNPNVFYELGLAYGINQKILVISHKKSDFGSYTAKYMEEVKCIAYFYEDLNQIEAEKFPLSKFVWKPMSSPYIEAPSSPIMLFLELEELASINKKKDEIIKPQISSDIELDFNTHVKSAIGVAIDNISKELNYTNNGNENAAKDDFNDNYDKSRTYFDKNKLISTYISQINGLKNVVSVRKDARFKEVMEQVQKAFCLVIRTGGKNCNPMAYFWLGYCHAIGKNVIPISVITNPNDKIDDLAFDIRALWHMTFIKDNPILLAPELKDIFHQMIETDFTEWSRKRFWDEILGKRGKVSIFTGALHIKDFGREMIGDWDLRAASEIASYFAGHHYRATIESPVYQIEAVEEQKINHEQYIQELIDMLKDKNCIIIASPDVNPFTEIALGEIYGIPLKSLFKETDEIKGKTDTVVAMKEKVVNEEESKDAEKRAFYKEVIIDRNKEPNRAPERGFESFQIENGKVTAKFLSQLSSKEEDFVVHAHLAIAPNPFLSKNEVHSNNENGEEEQKYILILNGLSGPATFALTHVLTGGVSKEFVSYESDFNPESESEKILKEIIKDLSGIKESRCNGLQYIIEVTVGPSTYSQSGTTHKTFDWRRIKKWKLVGPNNSQIRAKGNFIKVKDYNCPETSHSINKKV